MKYVRKSNPIEAIAVQEVLGNVSLVEDCDWDSLPDWFKDGFEDGSILIGSDSISVNGELGKDSDWVACCTDGLFIATESFMRDFVPAQDKDPNDALAGDYGTRDWAAPVFIVTALLIGALAGVLGGLLAGLELARLSVFG